MERANNTKDIRPAGETHDASENTEPNAAETLRTPLQQRCRLLEREVAERTQALAQATQEAQEARAAAEAANEAKSAFLAMMSH